MIQDNIHTWYKLQPTIVQSRLTSQTSTVIQDKIYTDSIQPSFVFGHKTSGKTNRQTNNTKPKRDNNGPRQETKYRFKSTIIGSRLTSPTSVSETPWYTNTIPDTVRTLRMHAWPLSLDKKQQATTQQHNKTSANDKRQTKPARRHAIAAAQQDNNKTTHRTIKQQNNTQQNNKQQTKSTRKNCVVFFGSKRACLSK